MSIEALLDKFVAVFAHPKAQLKKYKTEGKEVTDVLPYRVPEEFADMAGMVPMGVRGADDQTISTAKEYRVIFYCTIAQLGLGMLLDGTLDELDGVITPITCDTLCSMLQDVRVAMGGKMPTISFAHPQNRFAEWGLQFAMDQYHEIKRQLEEIALEAITPGALQVSIRLYNCYRHAARRFVELVSEHCDVITAVKGIQVLKSTRSMAKSEYTPLLEELSAELEKLPATRWTGSKVMTGGIICNNPKLLQILGDNHIVITTDDVTHESRFLKTDISETDDPIRDLVMQFTNCDHDILPYDPQSIRNRRGEFVAEFAKKSGAQGLVLFMQQSYDPEEMECPCLKKALDDAGIPHIKLGIDQQMRDFGQAQTAIRVFVDVLSS